MGTAKVTAARTGRIRRLALVGVAAALLAVLLLLARAAVTTPDTDAADATAPTATAHPAAAPASTPRATAPALRGTGEARRLPYGEAPFTPSRPPPPGPGDSR